MDVRQRERGEGWRGEHLLKFGGAPNVTIANYLTHNRYRYSLWFYFKYFVPFPICIINAKKHIKNETYFRKYNLVANKIIPNNSLKFGSAPNVLIVNDPTHN